MTESNTHCSLSLALDKLNEDRVLHWGQSARAKHPPPSLLTPVSNICIPHMQGGLA